MQNIDQTNKDIHQNLLNFFSNYGILLTLLSIVINNISSQESSLFDEATKALRLVMLKIVEELINVTENIFLAKDKDEEK